MGSLIRGTVTMTLILFCGCASVNNLSILSYKDAPGIRIEKDPALNKRIYSTVCAIPIAKVKTDPWSIGITQSQISSFVANALNAMGYGVVSDASQADLVVAVDAIAKDASYSIPPYQYQVPIYVPPQTIDINSNDYGNFYGGLGYPRSNFSGYYYGNTQTQVTLPGYMTTETMLFPGEFVKQFGHLVQLFIYDGKTGQCVYSAAGYATSALSDVRIGCQFLVISCIAQMPRCASPYWQKEENKNKYYPGFSCMNLTIDGNNYFPTVLGLNNAKTAEKSGLRVGDIITAVNGQSVVNLFDEQVFQLLCSDSQGSVKVTIYRTGKTIELVLPLQNTVAQVFQLN